MLSTDTWTGMGADANRSTAGNWSPVAVPVAGDNWCFRASGRAYQQR